MHLLIALKCPSSHRLFLLLFFFLGFYLESCYNLCHAIRFLSAGSGREHECEAGEGTRSLVKRQRRQHVHLCSSQRAKSPAWGNHRTRIHTSPGNAQLGGQKVGLKQSEKYGPEE